MNKDWFNGNIKSEHVGFVKFSLIFCLIVMLVVGIFLVFMGLFYDNISDNTARIVICVLGGVICLLSVGMFVLSIWAIRNYPKHKKLAHMFIKKFYFVGEDEQ